MKKKKIQKYTKCDVGQTEMFLKTKNTREVMLGKQKCCNGGLEARRGHLTPAPRLSLPRLRSCCGEMLSITHTRDQAPSADNEMDLSEEMFKPKFD